MAASPGQGLHLTCCPRSASSCAASLHPARASASGCLACHTAKEPRRRCFTIACLRGFCPAGPCERTRSRVGTGPGGLWWCPRCHLSHQVPGLTSNPLSLGSGQGLRLMLRIGCRDRASCLVPSGALRLHPECGSGQAPGPMAAGAEELRRLVWALKSQGLIETGLGTPHTRASEVPPSGSAEPSSWGSALNREEG